MLGVRLPVRIIPFRGEYYFLTPEAQSLVRGLIYPVPDPRFPFLGVHFTRTVHGQVEAGPNAVLAFAREGYRMGRVHPGELWGTLAYRGFWAMSRRHWRTGLMEVRRSLSKAAFTRSLQRLVPEVESRQLVRGGAGVRAQAVDRNGAPGGRLPHQRDAERHPRAQRALARRNGLTGYRGGHRRHGGELLRAVGMRARRGSRARDARACRRFVERLCNRRNGKRSRAGGSAKPIDLTDVSKRKPHSRQVETLPAVREKEDG